MLFLSEFKQYQEYHEERTAERANFRKRHPLWRSQHPTPFPTDLSEAMLFVTWLEADVDEKLTNNDLDVHSDVTYL